MPCCGNCHTQFISEKSDFSTHDDGFVIAPQLVTSRLLKLHLADLGLSCAEAAYIGDSEGDMRMAKSASAVGLAQREPSLIVLQGSVTVINILGICRRMGT